MKNFQMSILFSEQTKAAMDSPGSSQCSTPMGRKASILHRYMNEERRKLEQASEKPPSELDTSLSTVISTESMDMEDVSTSFSDENDYEAKNDAIQEDSGYQNTDNSSEEEISDETRSNKKLLKCSSCKYSTIHVGFYRAHMRSHTGEKPYTCDICDEKFAYGRSLSQHMKLHASRFRCMKCQETFLCDIELNDHKSKCTEDSFRCHYCKYTTKRWSYMKEHIQTHGVIRKLHECTKCLKYFAKKSSLSRHLKAHIDLANAKLRQKKLERENQQLSSVATNVTKFPFECAKCKLPFLKEYDQRAHEELCQRKQYNHLWNFSNVKVHAKGNKLERSIEKNNDEGERQRKENENKNGHLNGAEQRGVRVDFNEPCQENANDDVLWRPW